MKQKVLVIVGPTASGKSALAVNLAKVLGGEIISADSRQIYKGLDIGTGKITKKEMGGIPHHLLSITSAKRVYSASDFKRLAEPVIDRISAQGKVPIIVGGTGFYIDVLTGKFSLPDVPPNPILRKKLEAMPAAKLWNILLKLDPERAGAIDRNNPARLVRAIEIAKALGRVPAIESERKYEMLWIGLIPKPEVLKERIQKRLRLRLKQGMIAEVKTLHQKGLSWKRMEALGLEYRLISRFLRGILTKEEMIEHLEREIGRYAKRQNQWFRANKDVVWFDPDLKTTEQKVQKAARLFLDRS